MPIENMTDNVFWQEPPKKYDMCATRYEDSKKFVFYTTLFQNHNPNAKSECTTTYIYWLDHLLSANDSCVRNCNVLRTKNGEAGLISTSFLEPK